MPPTDVLTGAPTGAPTGAASLDAASLDAASLDAASLDKAAAYRLLISLLIPRPIAWIGSRSADGVDNLAPFSFFMGVSADPPLIAVSIARGRGGRLKDTARNVLETGAFSVSMVERPQLEAMHQTGADWPGPEFDAVGVRRLACDQIPCPRPAGARVALECALHKADDLGSTHLILGRVLRFHVDRALWRPDPTGAGGIVTLDGYDPVARLGGDSYAALGAITALPRVKLPG